MNILITYDVSLIDEEGKRRLRKVAKICQDYGQRVQNSVFECVISNAQYVILKAKLSEVINSTADTIRLYNLGQTGFSKMELLGKETSYNPEAPLII